MRTAIVGAGPTGLYLALRLARRGQPVLVVDRDLGPNEDGSWERQGVMQFHHPHAFRSQVVAALAARLPDVLDALLAAGAGQALVPGAPASAAGLRCRRLTFERVLRAAAAAEPAVSFLAGHVDGLVAERGRVAGIRVGGAVVPADLVLDASGRTGRLGRGLRDPARDCDCGISYVSRQYELLPGAEDGPVNAPLGLVLGYPGYLALVFLHDNRTITALISRASGDDSLAGLRHAAAFDAATAAIPGLSSWTDPGRARPLTGALPGGRLRNSYQGQLDEDGRVALDGLVFVGDTVCTTNPVAGRGVATGLLQAEQLMALLAEHGPDVRSCAYAFDAWCREHIEPWFADHVDVDDQLRRRWAGEPVDLRRPLPSDLVVAAAAAAPQMMRIVGPYLAMQALPQSLAAVEPQAREMYATGWRPPVPAGPTRDELAELVAVAR